MRPVLFELPVLELPIYGYGFMLGLSFLAGWMLCMRFLAAERFDEKLSERTLLVLILSSLVGARLLHVITNPTDFADAPWRALFLWEGGLVAYGGFLGASLGTYLYLRRQGQSFWRFADACVPSTALGLGITRLGCFLRGCCFGQPAELSPLAVTFPRHSPAWETQVAAGLIPDSAATSLPVYPTQIFESLLGFVVLGVLLWLRPRKRFQGQLVLTLAALYAVGRFLLEFIRADPERGAWLGLSTSQWIGLLLLGLLFPLYRLLRDRPLVSPSVESAPPASRSRTKRKRKRRKRR